MPGPNAGDEDPFPHKIKTKKGSLIIIDIADFENGMNGWEFKSWMPKTREASAAIVKADGLRSKHVLQFDADGRDDDGIFFIQKTYKADIEGPWKQAVVSWWFKGPGIIGVTAWPRVVYLGPPIDLARQESQHTFHWFQGQDGMSTCPECQGWYTHTYRTNFDKPIIEFQACIGWKINWETKRTLYMDDVCVQAT